METETILLLVGITFVFLGIFGGGFRIKEISIPKLSRLSRILGSVFGLALMVLSQQSLFIGLLGSGNGGDPTVVVQPEGVTDPGISEPISEPAPDTPTELEKLTADLDELEPLWEDLSFENDFLLKDYETIAKHESMPELGPVQRNNLERRIRTLKTSIISFDNLKLVTDNDLKSVPEKQEAIAKFESDSGVDQRVSTLDREYVDKIGARLTKIVKESASVAGKNNMLACKKIVNGNCAASTDHFTSEKVSVWAKLKSPGSETVRFEWFDTATQQSFYSRPINITKSTGYRIHNSKNISESGQYEVRLYNGDDELIGRTEFKVELN